MRVEVEVALLHVLAVVALGAGQAEEPLLEDRVAAVPEGQGEAEPALAVGDAQQAVLAPAVGAAAGVVVREVVPARRRRPSSPRAPCPTGARRGTAPSASSSPGAWHPLPDDFSLRWGASAARLLGRGLLDISECRRVRTWGRRGPYAAAKTFLRQQRFLGALRREALPPPGRSVMDTECPFLRRRCPPASERLRNTHSVLIPPTHFCATLLDIGWWGGAPAPGQRTEGAALRRSGGTGCLVYAVREYREGGQD